jgi:hypothetical protein
MNSEPFKAKCLSAEAVSKCFPITSGFKIKEGENFTTPLKCSGTGIHTLKYFED